MKPKFNKPLKFLHITKNAGSTIEKEAVKAGVLFGRFDDELKNYLNTNVFGLFWHYPVYNFKPELFTENDVFVVVRNPHERAVSELFWELEENGLKVNKENFSKDDFNKLLQDKLKIAHPKNVGHWLKQSEYVFDKEGKKVVKHILKIENLTKEFNELMKKYNLPVYLDKDIKHNTSQKIYEVKDLYPETIKLINEVYREDFDNFGYKKN